MALLKTSINLICFLLLLPFILLAQEPAINSDSVNVDPVKRQWEFKKKNWKTSVSVTEGDALKVFYRASEEARRYRAKGFLLEIADESLVLYDVKKKQTQVPKDHIYKIKVVKENHVFLGILGVIAMVLGFLLLFAGLVAASAASLVGEEEGNSGPGLLLGGAIVGIVGLVLIIFFSPQKIDDPFKGDWEYTEQVQADPKADKKDTFHP